MIVPFLVDLKLIIHKRSILGTSIVVENSSGRRMVILGGVIFDDSTLFIPSESVTG